jgi:lipopolysaccharide export system protein LptC
MSPSWSTSGLPADQILTAAPDARATRAYWTLRRGDTERAFRRARTHSRSVRLLRVIVPAAMVVLVAGFVAWTWFNPMRLLFKVPDIGGDLVISGTKITMQQPRVTGYTRDSRPYEFSASAAAQDMTRPDIVELHDMHGKVQMQDNSTTELTAESGTYNSKQEMLELGAHTVVTSTNGYKVLLDNARIDIRNTQLTTDEPVQIEMKQGQLNARRMEVRDAGAQILFDGVTMTINPDQLNRLPAAPGQSGPSVQ